jgi:hypothetical protein
MCVGPTRVVDARDGWKKTHVAILGASVGELACESICLHDVVYGTTAETLIQREYEIPVHTWEMIESSVEE